MFNPQEDRFAAACIALVVLLEIVLGISPQADRMTWAMENAPVWIGMLAWLWTRKRFQLGRLCLGLFTLHTVILMVGGYYTYAKVPLGDWVKDWLGLARNHYDRLGHFTQGFIPAIFVRELLLRVAKLPHSRWIPVLGGERVSRVQCVLRIHRMVDGVAHRRCSDGFPRHAGRPVGYAMGHVPRVLRRDGGATELVTLA